MKQYPDYKYRPRRRKGQKKNSGSNPSNRDQMRSNNKSPLYGRNPRSNSFSFGDFSMTGGKIPDLKTRLSSSAPRESAYFSPSPMSMSHSPPSLSMSPSSEAPSSPDDYTHDQELYYNHRHHSSTAFASHSYDQFGNYTTFSSGSCRPLVSASETLCAQAQSYSETKIVKLDSNANYCGAMARMDNTRYQSYCTPSTNYYYPNIEQCLNPLHSESRINNVHQQISGYPNLQDGSQPEIELISGDDLSGIIPDELNIYLNPNTETGEQTMPDISAFLKENMQQQELKGS